MNISKTLILIPFIWVFCGGLFFENGDKVAIVTILLSSFVSLKAYGMSSIKENVDSKFFMIVFVMMVYSVFSYYYHGSSSRELRAIIGCFIFISILPRGIVSEVFVKLLVVMSSISAFVSTFYFSVYLQLSRDAWPINAIPHGAMVASVAVFSLVFIFNSNKKSDYIVFTLSFFMSVVAVMLNQSRGIWLALILSSVVVVAFNIRIKDIKIKHIMVVFTLITLGLYMAYPKVKERLYQTKNEIIQIKSGDINTSLGIRFQLWKAASITALNHPVIGSGDLYHQDLKKLADEGYVSKQTAEYTHYHNQYLDKLVKSGVLGLVLLFCVILIPLTITSGTYRQMTIGLVLIYAIASLTDIPFSHGISLLMYLFSVAMFERMKTKNDSYKCLL